MIDRSSTNKNVREFSVNSLSNTFRSRFLANLVAVFGEFDISGEFEKKRAVTKNVKRVIVHRNYDAATFENDLALLELESPIHFDTHIGELIHVMPC